MNIDTVARLIADSHGLDHDTALDVARVHLQEIQDDAALYDIESGEFTEQGADVITGAAAASFALEQHSTAADRVLIELQDAAAKVEDTKEAHAASIEERDILIRAAMRTDASRAAIAAAAGVKEPRLYQIRDGRR